MAVDQKADFTGFIAVCIAAVPTRYYYLDAAGIAAAYSLAYIAKRLSNDPQLLTSNTRHVHAAAAANICRIVVSRPCGDSLIHSRPQTFVVYRYNVLNVGNRKKNYRTVSIISHLFVLTKQLLFFLTELDSVRISF